MKIYQKLLCGFLAISFLPLIVSYVSNLALEEEIISNFQEVGGEIMPSNIILARMTAELYHTLLLTTRFDDQRNKKDKKKIDQAISTLNTYKTMHKVYHHDDDICIKIDNYIQRFSSYITEYILLIQKNAPNTEIDEVKSKINRLLDDFVSLVDPHFKTVFNESLNKLELTEKKHEDSHKIVIGSTLIILIIAFLSSLYGSRILSKPILELRDAALQISKGKLDINLETNSKDEIGELARAFNQMAINLSKERTGRTLAEANEAKIKEIADKLKRSNSELQEFAFIASHDLQEPLRKVTGFGSRLKEKYSDTVDERGRDYIDRMMNAASRMQALIDGLLDYSRVTTKAKAFTQVNLSTIAQEVLSDLEVRIDQTGAKIEVDNLPTIDADELQMRQLFQNLLGNALKFHKTGEKPSIKISSETTSSGHTQHNEKCKIIIEDQGIGFDNKHSNRIFEVFQRLHGRNEYQGTGIGLSVCKKIVGRHNGNISVKSASGKGSVFTVTLPLKQKEAIDNIST